MTEEQSRGGPTELVVVSAADDAALAEELQRIVKFIDRVPDASLLDIAYTCALVKGRARVAFVASSTADLRARLDSARSRIESGAARLRDKSGTYYCREHLAGDGGGKLAFVFPGALSFYPDMLRDLIVTYPECRAPFDTLEEAMADDPEFTPSNFIFPPAPYYRHDADIFSSGAYAEAFVSTTVASMALANLLSATGLRPDGVVGCAGGDLAAALSSGAAGAGRSRGDSVKALREIYRTISKAIDHEGLPRIIMVTALLRHGEDLAGLMKSLPPGAARLTADLSPKMKTFAIKPEHEEEAMKAFANAGIRTLRLDLDRPFNTPDCAPLVAGVKKFASNWIKFEPVCVVWSCAAAAPLSPKPRAVRSDMAERWANPVRFADTVKAMHAAGYRVFLEVGPRGLMTSAIEETLEGGRFAAIALNSIHRSGRLQLHHGLAQLASAGADLDLAPHMQRRRPRRLDFDSSLSLETRRDSEMKLSRAFPKLALLGGPVSAASYLAEPKGRGAKVAARAAAKAAREGFRLQFESGSADPLISDAPPTEQSPGVSYAFAKTYRLSDAPFIGDFAYGASQLSYSDPNLRGLVMLPIPVAVEIMAETALRVIPNRHIVRIEDFTCRRQVPFRRGSLKLAVRAERVSPDDPGTAAVKVQIRTDSPDGAFTWPFMEANVVLAGEPLPVRPANVDPLVHPRTVHWSGRDIYPLKLGSGRRLRGIVFAEDWSENGLNYEVEVPPLAGNVTFTRLPLWAVNPLLLHDITSGFKLWRCHERFSGAFSFPFRFRRLELRGPVAKEGARLNCYLRLTGVTPRSHLCDMTVTDGNGGVVMEMYGWEEITERVPKEFCEMVLQPATKFVSEALSPEMFGDPGTEVASAMISGVPYPVFERNEELWLKILSSVVLNAPERKELAEMKGSVSRRTEWLFGRIAVKEAVRRYLSEYHQARWSYADVQIWPNENGKPQAIGAWGDNLKSRIDVAIAHTSQFVIALAAANAKVGVDVESVSRNLSEEFATGVFTPEELALAAKTTNAAQAIIRFWCAKEAVSKALGTGIRFPPKEMTVTDYLQDSGRMTVRLAGAWVEVFKNFRGRDITVATRAMREHALAFCFIPASLFNEN
ncbi:MAG: 4'-phosphopantetheinyl transferase superfamily protein [Kiritimatiellae bacterium]|nr:4'-phosphopantetheinyl transferase superfamily protein [Kiritimatiellia bacterium]